MRALVGAAIGAGLVFTSGLTSWLITERQRTHHAFALKYVKAGGDRPKHNQRLEDDPTPVATPATRYVTWIASRCRISRWSMTNNEGHTDVPDQAILTIKQEDLADRQFNCLAGFVKPQFVTLTRMTY